MREETFFEHCLRLLERGDAPDELQELLEKAINSFQSGNLSESEEKIRSKLDFSARAKKSWETRRKKQESAELEAKSKVYPQ